MRKLLLAAASFAVFVSTSAFALPLNDQEFIPQAPPAPIKGELPAEYIARWKSGLPGRRAGANRHRAPRVIGQPNYRDGLSRNLFN